MRAFAFAVVVALASVAISTGTSVAQDPTPQPGRVASTLLPEAADFGEGWELSQTSGLELDAQVFREGAVGFYLGPRGSRVASFALLITESRVAIRQSWEAANELFEQYYYELDSDYDRADELGSIEPPDGCAEARRIDGRGRVLLSDAGFPSGMTMCAADPDIILVTLVSGWLGDLSGYEASDAVVALMLAAGPATANDSTVQS